MPLWLDFSVVSATVSSGVSISVYVGGSAAGAISAGTASTWVSSVLCVGTWAEPEGTALLPGFPVEVILSNGLAVGVSDPWVDA